MDISVIIVNFNTASLLKECLKSIGETSEDINLEILVVDNNSRDKSVEMVRNEFPKVRLVSNSENIGFARGVNQALDLARGNYYLLLNPDVKLLPGTIRGMMDFMNSKKDAGLAGVQLLNADRTKQNSIANFPDLAQEFFNKSLLKFLFPKRYPSKYQEYVYPIEVESVIGACMIARREAVEKVGKLDSEYFIFLEETDWCYQMKKKGWKIYHLPEFQVIHEQGQSLQDFRSRGRIEYYRSFYKFFRKNYSMPTYLLSRILIPIKTLINMSLNLTGSILTLGLIKKLKEKFSIYLHLLIWHLVGCPGREVKRYGSFFKI